MNSIWDLKEYILLLDLDDVYIFYKGDFSFSFVHLNFLVLKTDSLISNIFRSRYFSKDTTKKYDERKSFHVACRGNRNNRNLHRLSNCMSYSCNNITFVQLLPKEKSVSKGSSPILFGWLCKCLPVMVIPPSVTRHRERRRSVMIFSAEPIDRFTSDDSNGLNVDCKEDCVTGEGFFFFWKNNRYLHLSCLAKNRGNDTYPR